MMTSTTSTTTTKIFLTIFLLISIPPISSKPCDVLENMSCDCHQTSNNHTEQLKCTNFYTPLNGSVKLINYTSRAFDSFHLTFHSQEFNVTPMFINELSYLFARPTDLEQQAQQKPINIKIILTFQDYHKLHFEDYAFYQLFGHQSSVSTSLSLELTSSGQITFAPMALTQLTVDQMSVHTSSLEPYTFEELFNQTHIGSLSVEGCTPRSNLTLRRYFTGKIRSAKFTKMAEIVSSEEFPDYPVGSMIIEAHEPRRINATTFTNYHNLHGVHLIRPKFFFDNRSFDGFQYLAHLDTLELDAETIKANTFQPVTRIRYFTLGPSIRYLFDHSFDHLDYLNRLDLSKIILDNLYPTSKCILARYIHKQHLANPAMIILPPQAEYCDCVYDFILHLLKKKPEHSYTEICRHNQEERCQLNECDLVKNFRPPTLQQQAQPSAQIPSIDENFLVPSIPIYQPEVPIVRTNTRTRTRTRTTTTAPIAYHPRPSAKVGDEYDGANGSSFADTQVIVLPPLPYSSPPQSDLLNATTNMNKSFDTDADVFGHGKNGHSQSHLTIPKSRTFNDGEQEKRRMKKKAVTFKWISLSLLCITVLSIILVAALVWHFTCRASRKREKAGFQPVPAKSTNV